MKSTPCPVRWRGGWKRNWPWVLGLMIAFAFAIGHTLMINHYLDRATAQRLSDEPVRSARLSRIVPDAGLDGMTWTREIVEMHERGEWRLRYTYTDNAPEGRPVYWNSGWAWWHLGWAWLHRAFGAGENDREISWPAAIEWAAAWVNLPTLLLAVTGFSWWVMRRWGAAAGALLAVALVGSHTFYEGFSPAYNDHHGIVNIGLLALVLGAVFGGLGWRRGEGVGVSPAGLCHLPGDRRAARIGFIVSALGGAFGLWINAASVVIAIGLTGVMAVVAAALAGRGLRAQGLACEPGLWRMWGRWGAAASVMLFLIEQCPDRLLAWRLEVNHPLYALAWLGGGEGVALLLEKLQGGRLHWRRAVLALAAACAAPLAILIWRERVFVPLDPFVARIHENIGEFLSLPARIAELGWRHFMDQAGFRLLLFILAAATLWRLRRQPVAVLILSFALAVALPMYAMGWWQMRWMLPASVPQIVLAVAMLDMWLPDMAGGSRPLHGANRRSGLRRAGVLLASLVLFAPMPALLARSWWRTERQKGVHAGEAMFLLYRDIASTLRSDRPEGRIVLLSNPNASVAMGYFAGLETIGTLYWENKDGLRTAARILTALSMGTPSEVAEAERLVRKHGITHVVSIAGADFAGAYWVSLRPGEPLPERDQLTGGNAPVWLRPIPYAMPPQFRQRFKLVPRLYAVDFTQTEAEAHYRAGLAALTMLRPGEAEKRFDAARIVAPDTPQPWIRLAELRLAAGDAPTALKAMQEGIVRSPVEMREQLYIDASRLFQAAGAEKEANALLDLAIKAGGGA